MSLEETNFIIPVGKACPFLKKTRFLCEHMLHWTSFSWVYSLAFPQELMIQNCLNLWWAKYDDWCCSWQNMSYKKPVTVMPAGWILIREPIWNCALCFWIVCLTSTYSFKAIATIFVVKKGWCIFCFCRCWFRTLKFKFLIQRYLYFSTM